MTSADRGIEASLAAYDRGQERLRDAILIACEADAELPAKVEAALRAALSLLASDPDLAHLLTVWPDRADTQLWQRRSEWQRRYGELLRAAAADAGAPAPPFFLEPALIGGVIFVVASYVRVGRAKQLERLVPVARWYLLSSYMSAEDMARLAIA